MRRWLLDLFHPSGPAGCLPRLSTMAGMGWSSVPGHGAVGATVGGPPGGAGWVITDPVRRRRRPGQRRIDPANQTWRVVDGQNTDGGQLQ